MRFDSLTLLALKRPPFVIKQCHVALLSQSTLCYITAICLSLEWSKECRMVNGHVGNKLDGKERERLACGWWSASSRSRFIITD